MRTYYLFKINEQIKHKLNTKELYIILDNMYHLNNINYEVSLYNKVCKLIDIDVISSYLNKTCHFMNNHNKYLFNDFLVELNRSVIVIKSKINIPIIFRILNIYSKDFFVIDFDNKDYFWLEEIIENKIDI